jgi:FKBP-type peptidyl-prolyl cis-trans isomerase 2
MSKGVRRVEEGDLLLIAYQIRHGSIVLESSEPEDSVEYQMGVGHWPLRLELALMGATVGERLNIALNAADNAFGRVDPERVIHLDVVDFVNVPEPGELIEFNLENNEAIEGQVLSVFGDKIEVDFNHPYVGRDLDFTIHIKSIL